MMKVDALITDDAFHGVEDVLLESRERTHGSYVLQSTIAQALKSLVRSAVDNHSDGQIEALEMICVKMARILAGDPDHADHWDDIAGYARLVARDCQR